MAESEVFDLVGVGFGPSNLAIATLIESLPDRGWKRKRVIFLEKQPRFGWHADMLLAGARMQISFLKDLVTLKAPTSPYTFINYLKEQGRLDDFINLQTFHPTRDEFHRYLSWAAGKLSHFVRYGATVEQIRPVVRPDESVDLLEVHYRDQASCREHQLRSRNVVVAPGGAADVPAEVTLGRQIFHSSRYLDGIARYQQRPDHPYRFLVVGAGQSAAEIFRHLIDTFPGADITLVIRRFALAQAESSPLANEIFNSENVDLFYGLPEAQRDHCLEELASTNYSAVDDHLVQDIFRRLYEQRMSGRDRFRIRRFTSLTRCRADGEQAAAVLCDLATGATMEERFDGIVLATGYRSTAESFLRELEDHLVQPRDRPFAIRRDYSLEPRRPARFQPRIYVQGLTTERSHGLTSSLLSVLPFRAEDILESAFGPAAATAPSPGVPS